MQHKIKVKVSPAQMKFYEDNYPGSKVEMIKRMVREFNLGMSMANNVYDNFPDSFTVIASSADFDRPFIPSHSSDHRSSVFLQSKVLDKVDELMRQHVGGDPYTHFMEITEDIREEVFSEIQNDNNIENEEKLFLAKIQYPIGVYPIQEGGLENVKEMKNFLQKQVEEGADLSEVASDFLNSITSWDQEQKVVAYIAVADLLYGTASDAFKKMKGDLKGR